MGKEHKKRPARTNEETAFEWGDFAAHEPLWIMEEQKRAKEMKRNEKSRDNAPCFFTWCTKKPCLRRLAVRRMPKRTRRTAARKTALRRFRTDQNRRR
ncbi:hypothetical protein Gste01_01712 [Geobacillus stearothermophilus ATCC 7953]